MQSHSNLEKVIVKDSTNRLPYIAVVATQVNKANQTTGDFLLNKYQTINL